MAVTVKLPFALRRLTEGHATLTAEGSTAGEVVEWLLVRYPALRTGVFDQAGQLKAHLRLFVQDREATLASPLTDGDELLFLFAITGGD